MKRNRPLNTTNKKNLFIILTVLSLIFSTLILRLFYIMISNGKSYKTIAISQHVDKVIMAARRGRIVDKNGRELALSADVYRVDLDMTVVKATLAAKEMPMEKLANDLAATLKMDLNTVNKILNQKTDIGLPVSFVTLKRRIEKTEADAVSDLKIRGILISSDSKRYYSNNDFLAHVLGTTDPDGKGLTGVELKYDSALKGIDGVRIAEADVRNNQLPYSDADVTLPVDGKDVVLTIDEKIQQITEEAAKTTLLKNKAHSVSITIMNPQNGEILAMATKPDFNPNAPRKEGTPIAQLQEMWKNPSVQNAFEPGSIFKIMTSAAAMEKGVVKESDKFVCKGYLNIAGRTIYCNKRDGHGTQNFVEILKNSCNVGYMELGKKLGKDNLTEFIKKMGFGELSGVDLPGENKGIVKNVKDISEVDLATISFGQSIAVTQVQFMAAFNAVANGGTLIQPHIVKELAHKDENNQRVAETSFDGSRNKKVLDEGLTNTLRGYLEKVVTEGGSREAFIEGLRIGGKTGTAQRVNTTNGAYEPEKYVSSFVAMAPADKPVITIMITIDQPDPSNYYAGQTAAPAAKELFTELMSHISLDSVGN